MQGSSRFKNWLQLVLALVCGVLLAGVYFRIASPPRGSAVRLLPPPTPAPLVIHVAGAVQNPGLYRLAAGSRVKDAVDAAGGFLPQANSQSINLAAFLEDGERILVLAIPPTAAPMPEFEGKTATLGPSFPIDINTATQIELESLPGIGPTIAGRIIAYRESHGGFKNIEQILDVQGIGEGIFAQIKELIIVQ
jgi:competence protein ComEA